MPTLELKLDHSPIRTVLLNCVGVIIGVFFGIPPALGAHAMGLDWMPYGIAVITIGLVVGLLMASLVDALLPRKHPFVGRTSPAPETNNRAESGSSKRLSEQKARLDRLAAERRQRGDSVFGKTTEDRIVWGELLDLELQDIDEQLTRICRTTDEVPPAGVRVHRKSTGRDQGGSYGRNDA
jgi:hypothetical protein